MTRFPGFTDHASNFIGTFPYTARPSQNPSTRTAPAVRPQRAPPVTAPAPGPYATRKTATNPIANPFYWTVNTPGMGTTGG